MHHMRHLEASGHVAKAVARLVRELRATKIINYPTGTVTLPDYRRQIDAVQVAGQILGPDA